MRPLRLFLHGGRRLRPSQAWLLAGPLAGAAVLGFVAVLTGSAGAYGVAQAAWGRTGTGSPPSGAPIGSALDLNQAVP